MLISVYTLSWVHYSTITLITEWCQIEWWYMFVCEINIREELHFDWTVEGIFWEVVFILQWSITIRDSLVVIGTRTENGKKKDFLPTSTDTHMVICIRWFLIGIPLNDFVYSYWQYRIIFIYRLCCYHCWYRNN